MKITHRLAGLLAVTAIPVFARPLDPAARNCDELKNILSRFYIDGSHLKGTDVAVVVALEHSLKNMGCFEDPINRNITEGPEYQKPDVNVTAHLEPRHNNIREPLLANKCDQFQSKLAMLNGILESNLTSPAVLSPRSDTNDCAIVHESLPEIDIWSNRCASQHPEIGLETVKLVDALQKMGCIWTNTCGPACPKIGNDMFEAVTNMGVMQCNRYDAPGNGPRGIPATLKARSLPSNESLKDSAKLPVSSAGEVHNRSCTTILKQRAEVDPILDYYISNHEDVPYYVFDWQNLMYNLMLYKLDCKRGTSPFANGTQHALTCEDVITAMTDLDQLTLFYFHNVDVVPDWLWDWQRLLNTMVKTVNCNVPEAERAERLVERMEREDGGRNCENVKLAKDGVFMVMKDPASKGRESPVWAGSLLASLENVQASLGCDA